MHEIMSFLQGVDGVLDWLVDKSPLVGVIGGGVAVWLAVIGYKKWLPEVVGKRKSELAEDVIAGFYHMKDIIGWARFPGGYESEGASRESDIPEGDDERRMKNSYYRTVERLQNEGTTFSDLMAKKYRAMAYFGRDAGKDFDDSKELRARLIITAGQLIRYYNQRTTMPEDKWDKWEAMIGWGLEEDDEFSGKLDALVKRVEQFYGQWLLRKG